MADDRQKVLKSVTKKTVYKSIFTVTFFGECYRNEP